MQVLREWLQRYWANHDQWTLDIRNALQTSIDQLATAFHKFFPNIPVQSQDTPPPPASCPSVMLPMCVGTRLYNEKGCLIGVKCGTGIL